jgi:hypothetical protein
MVSLEWKNKDLCNIIVIHSKGDGVVNEERKKVRQYMFVFVFLSCLHKNNWVFDCDLFNLISSSSRHTIIRILLECGS